VALVAVPSAQAAAGVVHRLRNLAVHAGGRAARLAIALLMVNGVGVWGVNNPTGWGFAIINFVFWVGIGHAGTLISAILFLFRQKWRTSINRFAEAMTIFAVMCAGIFPGIHVGRVWVTYWMVPIPNQMAHVAELPQPAAVGRLRRQHLRDRLAAVLVRGDDPGPRDVPRPLEVRPSSGMLYGIFALGWTGSSRHWHRFERAYLILAALATPLVLSVHSVVSFDFAVAQLPGWHTTIFPPYFVAGAIFGGFAMVVTLAIPARELFGLKNIITLRHLENCCKIILLTGMIVGYAYMMEFFIAWYSGSPYEGFIFKARALGPYAWAYWTMITCNVVAPQLFWFKFCRTNLWVMFLVVMAVNVGMWFERFVIVVSSLSQDFLPSNWDYYVADAIDILTLVGSFGLFFTLFLLFCRYLPMVAMAEVKTVMPHADAHAHEHEHVPARAASTITPTSSTLTRCARECRPHRYPRRRPHAAAPRPAGSSSNHPAL
jgi:Ni/Fe-hydrogenase subunit HybB-like protein